MGGAMRRIRVRLVGPDGPGVLRLADVIEDGPVMVLQLVGSGERIIRHRSRLMVVDD